MYGGEDSFAPTLVGELVNAALQYGVASWQKKKPGSYLPTATNGVVTVVGVGLKNHARHPYMQASLEASGSGAVAGLANFLAANTTTFGGVAAGPIPYNRSAHTASLARVRAGAVVRQPQAVAPGYAWSPMYEMGAGA